MSDEATINIDTKTLYSTLGLRYNATELEIRKSYMNLARILHPDKTGKPQTGELFKLVVHAHGVLTDDEQRKKYDKQIKLLNLLDYTPQGYRAKPSQPHIEIKQRKPLAYEKQPYGFGLSDVKCSPADDTTRPSGVDRFHLRKYQRNAKKHSDGIRIESPVTFGNRKTALGGDGNLSQNSADDENIERNIDEYKTKDDLMAQADWKTFEKYHDPEHIFPGERRKEKVQKTDSQEAVYSNETSQIPRLHSTHFNSSSSNMQYSINSESKDPNYEDITVHELGIDDDAFQRLDIRESIRGVNSKRRKMEIMEHGIDLSDLSDDLPSVKYNGTNKLQPSSKYKSYLGHRQLRSSTVDISTKQNRLKNKSFLFQETHQTFTPQVYNVVVEALDVPIPAIPELPTKITDHSSFAICKLLVSEFNMHCDALKDQILQVMSNRISRDRSLQDHYYEPSYLAHWNACKQYDILLTEKLQEIHLAQFRISEILSDLIMRSREL